MAELVIMPHADHPRYGEGDILCAFSDARIGEVHASHICHHDRHGFTSNGLREHDTLMERFDFLGYQYRYTRMSRTEIIRTDLRHPWKPDTWFGPTPNDAGEYIDVPQFIAARVRHASHRIFGNLGEEVWYGGQWTLKVEKIWAEIEERTEFRRIHHLRWPLGKLEFRNFLAITIDDAGDDLVEPLTRDPIEGEPADTPVVILPRAHAVDWRAFILPRIAFREQDILDRNVPIDIRDVLFERKTIVRLKGAP